MKHIHELEARRTQVLRELAAIRSLRKGSLNEQWFPVVRGAKKTGQRRGPYYVWTYKGGNRTVSERLKGEQAVAYARRQAQDYRRFKDLCAQLEQLTQQLGEAERQEGLEQEALKKGL